MRILRLIFLLVLPLALAACGDATGPEDQIVGGWARSLDSRMGEHLFFDADGGFRREIGPTGEVLGTDEAYWFRSEGEYRVRGDRLELRVTRQTEWRLGDPPHVTELTPGTWEDAGDVLVLGYVLVRTYDAVPPDAAVTTRATYQRVPHERPEILD